MNKNKFLNVVNPPRTSSQQDNIPFDLAFKLTADYSLLGEEIVVENDIFLVEDNDVHTRPTVRYMKRVSEVEVMHALWEIK